ncbi:nucleoside hydrolase, partial [Rhizobium ruizarguesonis]
TGLDGPELNEPTMALQPVHAVDFIIATLRHEPEGTVTLCTLGPLTNIGMAFPKAPDIIPLIRELVMMGRGFGVDIDVEFGGRRDVAALEEAA